MPRKRKTAPTTSKSRRRSARRRRSAGYDQAQPLEPRLLLGSLVPTETGTLAGGLLPIESADLLAPIETENLDAADTALSETLRQQQHIRSKVEWLAELRARREQSAADEINVDEDSYESGKSEERASTDESQAATPLSEQMILPDVPANDETLLAFGIDELTASLVDESAEADETSLEKPSDDGIVEDLDSEHAEFDNDDTNKEDEGDEFRREPGPESVLQAAHLNSLPGNPVSGRDDGATFSSGISPQTSLRTGIPGPRPVATGGTPLDYSGVVVNEKQVPAGGFHFAAEQPGQALITSRPPAPAMPIPLQPDSPIAQAEPLAVQYDFRDQGPHANRLSASEQAAAEAALAAWTESSDGRVEFYRNTTAPDSQIINLGKGDLAAFGYSSQPGGTLAVGGGMLTSSDSGEAAVTGVAWLDDAETWDTSIGNGDPSGTYDAFTVFAHEIGHVLGGEDASIHRPNDIMNGIYDQERGHDAIRTAVEQYEFDAFESDAAVISSTTAQSYEMHAMITGFPQLSAAEVEDLLDFSTAVTPSTDAIIAIVDRGGNILGVRVESGVAPAILADADLLTFAIDGAVAKARTAAFFANGDPANGTLAPITSRLVRFISQSTISYREVNSNPNSTDPMVRGPGFVAPIGLGGHFPPEILHTPPVDLFAIEHTNRDSSVHPGEDGIKGTADDITLKTRFNVDPVHIPIDTDGDGMDDNPDTDMDGLANSRIRPPDSYGYVSGRAVDAQARGIATLPGGVPLYRDTNADGFGDTLIGAVGVFFPGPDGTADFEQGFVGGIGQSETARTNAPLVMEAEFIAVATAGGSLLAEIKGAPGAHVSSNPVPDIDIPFGRLDLVGIQLPVIGPTAGIRGVQQLVGFGTSLGSGVVNGTDQVVDAGDDGMFGTMDDVTYRDGETVPFGWLVTPHDGGDFDGDMMPDITAAQVTEIIEQGIAEAELVRAAIRLPLGSRTRMVFAVTDKGGEVLGLYRMRDATVFSIDVAVAKARNTAYYADATPGVLQTEDEVSGFEGVVAPGTAFSNRTVRFLSEPRYPSGVQNSEPGDFSILHDLSAATGIPVTGNSNKVGLVESTVDIPASSFDSVLGHNAFNPATNFHDLGDGMVGTGDPDTDRRRHQNGIVFFPGSTPLYGSAALIGGFGVSGDGVDQDDVVTFAGAQGFLPPDAIAQADEVYVDGVRLPFIKFLRNPRG